MKRIKRFIDCYVPVTTCNLRCKYCYITQNNRWGDSIPKLDYSVEHIVKALSKDRLGGICHLNMCGGGETLLPKEMVPILKGLLEEGHYIMVVTNGTISKRFDEIIEFPKDLLNRLGFKFSFHYEELIRLNKLDEYFDNIRKIKQAGCSFSVEITPYDDLIDKIDDIKSTCLKNVGELCHVTVGRKDNDVDKPILTDYPIEEYYKIWDQFSSDLFEFKMSTFNKKRNEFCYAGDWSFYLNLYTGDMSQCYCGKFTQNIYKNLHKKIKYLAIGNNCTLPHCYNSHAFLTLGVIPELDTPYYSKMRNRILQNEEEWLNKDMKEVLSNKLYKNNKQYNFIKKLAVNYKNRKL